jgi:hypothetical protein
LEIFEKCSFLPAQLNLGFYLTGVQFFSDEEIGQKGTFCNGLADTDKHRRLRERKEFECADIHIPAPALSGSGSRGRGHAPPLSQWCTAPPAFVYAIVITLSH